MPPSYVVGSPHRFYSRATYGSAVVHVELTPVEQEDGLLKIEVDGEEDTILNLLREELLEQDGVEVATYTRGHPQLDIPHFKVQVSSGDPKKALLDAVKSLRKEYDEFETDFLDATS